MKKLIVYLIFIFFSNSILLSGDLENLKKDLETKAEEICLSEFFKPSDNPISNLINIKLEDYFSKRVARITNVALDSICFKTPKIIDFSSESLTITGETTILNNLKAQGKIRINKKEKFQIAVGIEVTGVKEFKPSQLSSDFSDLDDIIDFNNVSITYSDTNLEKPLFGSNTIKNGLTIFGDVTCKGILQAFGLEQATLNIYIPFGNNENIKFNFNPKISSKGICPAPALEQLVKNPLLELKPETQNFLELLIKNFLKDNAGNPYCFHTDVGITTDEKGNGIIFVSGNFEISGNTYKFMAKVSILRKTKTEPKKYILTIGFQPPSEIFTLEKLTTLKAFAPIDALFNFSEPLITLTNGKNQTIFDFELDEDGYESINPNKEGAIKVEEGLKVSINVHGQGLFKDSGFDKIKTSITIPIEAITAKDPSQIRIKFEPDKDLCFAKILTNAISASGIPIDSVMNGIINKFTTCFALSKDKGFPDMQVVFSKDQKAIFYIRGPVRDGVEAMIRIQGTDFTSAIVSTFKGLGDVYDGFKPIDSLLSVENPILAFSNVNNDEGFIFDFGTGPTEKRKLRKGLSILAPTKGDLAKFLDIQEIDVAITSDKVTKTTIDVISSKTKTCLSDLFKNTPFIDVATKLFGDLSTNCITKKYMMIEFIDSKAFIKYKGNIQIAGESIETTLYVDMKDKTPQLTMYLQAKSIDTANILSGPALGLISNLVSLKLINPQIIIATDKSDRKITLESDGSDKQSKGIEIDIEKGISLYSNLKFSGVVGDLLQFLGVGEVKGYLRIQNSSEFSIGFAKSIDKTLIDVIKMKDLGLTIDVSRDPITQTLKPKVSLNIDSTVSGRNVKLKGGINLQTQTVLLEGSIQGETIKFGSFPLEITNPAFGIYILAGQPTGLKIKGNYNFSENRILDINADVDIADPMKSLVYFNVKQLCLFDQIALLQKIINVGGKSITQSDLLNFKIPKEIENLLCVYDVSGSFNMSELVLDSNASLYKPEWIENKDFKGKCAVDSYSECEAFCKSQGKEGMADAKCENEKLYCACKEKPEEKTTIPTGIRLKGKLQINIPNIINTAGNVEITLSPTGIVGKGNLDKPIDLAGILKITSADDEKLPPQFGFTIPPKDGDQNKIFWIDGQIRFGQLVSSKTRVYLTTTGFDFNSQAQFLEFNSIFMGNIAFTEAEFLTKSQVTFKIEQTEKFTTQLDKSIEILNQDIKNLQKEASDELNSIKSGCGSLPLLSDMCKGFISAGDATMSAITPLFNTVSQKLADLISGIAKQTKDVFWINSIQLSANFAAFKKGGNALTATINYNLFGDKNKTFDINVPVPANMAEFFNSLVGPIYDNILKPVFDIFITQIKNLIETLKHFVSNLSSVIGSAIDVAVSAGNTIYSFGKLIFAFSPDSANQLAGAVTDLANNVKDLSVSIATTIKDLAVDVANTIKDAAVAVADFAVNTAKIVANGINKGALWIGKTIEQLANDLVNVLNLDKIFNPKNW